MSPTEPTTRMAALGTAIRAHRTGLHMSREAVAAAGGPSVATQRRVETGVNTTDIEVDTRHAFETALKLPPGWITDFLAGRIDGAPPTTEGSVVDDRVTELQTATGARLLVAVTDGVTRLTAKERKAIYAVLESLEGDSDE